MDEGAELLATLAATQAHLVDLAHSAGSDVSATGRSLCTREYRAVLVELMARVRPQRGEPDPWAELARELAAIDKPDAEGSHWAP
jgi:hypothetical protein